ncbi:MAG: hypothetical protein J6R31_06760 [Rikenellaceae bacterium]|nr:hypothetical protein [Rikenellaceae bacterium]
MKKLLIILCVALLSACGEEFIPNANKVDGQYVGVLQTTSLTDGEVFAENGVEFSLAPSAMGTMTLTMHNTHFVAMMPRLTMQAAGLQSKLVDYEHIISAPDEGIIPTIGEIKYPKYIITNLSGKRIVSADESGAGALSLTFHCRGYLVEYMGVTK